MDPDMDCSKSQKRLKACGHALPADHQAAILLLEPGKGALGLKSWHHVFDRSASIFLRLPDALSGRQRAMEAPRLEEAPVEVAEDVRIGSLDRVPDAGVVRRPFVPGIYSSLK